MQATIWEKIKSQVYIDPRSLLELHRAYRTKALNNYIISFKVLDLNKKRIVEEKLKLPHYLQLLREVYKKPRSMSPTILADLALRLATLHDVLKHSECEKGCKISSSPYPEFIYTGKSYHPLPAASLHILESLGITIDYLLRANPNTALSLLTQNPETIRKKLEAIARERRVRVEDLSKLYSPNTLLRLLQRLKSS